MHQTRLWFTHLKFTVSSGPDCEGIGFFWHTCISLPFQYSWSDKKKKNYCVTLFLTSSILGGQNPPLLSFYEIVLSYATPYSTSENYFFLCVWCHWLSLYSLFILFLSDLDLFLCGWHAVIVPALEGLRSCVFGCFWGWWVGYYSLFWLTAAIQCGGVCSQCFPVRKQTCSTPTALCC